MDMNSLVTFLLYGAVLLVIGVRFRAKRSDRKRDAKEREQRPRPTDRSLY